MSNPNVKYWLALGKFPVLKVVEEQKMGPGYHVALAYDYEQKTVRRVDLRYYEMTPVLRLTGFLREKLIEGLARSTTPENLCNELRQRNLLSSIL